MSLAWAWFIMAGIALLTGIAWWVNRQARPPKNPPTFVVPGWVDERTVSGEEEGEGRG